MRVIVGDAERGPVIAAGVVTSSLAILGLTVIAGLPSLPVTAIVALTVVAAVSYRSLLRWPTLLATTFLVILFLPIKRYVLPGNLPFDLEPYRVLVTIVVAGWIAALLVDPRVRLHRSGFETPIYCVLLAALASDIVNPGRVADVQSDVVKTLMFLLSYFLLFYLIVSVVRTRSTIDFLIKVLVGGGAIVAFFALVEFRTGFNVFDKIASSFMTPSENRADSLSLRGGDLRVIASAQGPIPLGAAFIVVLPLAIYLAIRMQRRRWFLAAGMLVLGAFATVSRTSVVMILVVGIVLLWLRPKQVKRFWPALIPMVLVLHVAVPGTIGSLRGAFFPAGGLIKEQSTHPGWRGSGRIADLAPALAEFGKRPLLGEGFGTRQPGREVDNAQILDDQWLKTLLETGIFGTIAWVWLIVHFLRRTAREAKRDLTERGWLLTAVAASVASFAVGMFLYDTFSFIQVTLLFFIVLGLGAAVLRVRPEGVEPDRRVSRAGRGPRQHAAEAPEGAAVAADEPVPRGLPSSAPATRAP
jgi:hypothetical protein